MVRVIFVFQMIVFMEILERIVHMMLLNVLLNARKILVESAHIRDHQYHPRKIEKIPVVNNTIPNLRYFF